MRTSSSLTGRRTASRGPRTGRAHRRTRFVEVGPQRVDEQQFGISRLPQQEIGQPHLARRADQQVQLRQTGGVELSVERLSRRSIAGLELAGGGFGREPAGRCSDLGARAVVEGDDQRQPAVAGGAVDRPSSRSTRSAPKAGSRRSAAAAPLPCQASPVRARDNSAAGPSGR